MSRFFCSKDDIFDDKAFIRGGEAHHLINVMRFSKGDAITLFDGTGTDYSAVIESVSKDEVILSVKERIESGKSGLYPDIVLYQAIPKKQKMEDIIEKASQLGLKRIVPIVTGRTVVKFTPQNALKKTDRWRKISSQSCKQCGRARPLEVSDITEYSDAIKDASVCGKILLAALTESAVDIPEALSGYDYDGEIALFIGPEGDFTPQEVSSAAERGAVILSLGSLVLKSDTAALFSVSAINTLFLLSRRDHFKR